MFLLLGGTGVGFSVQKHHVARLPVISQPYPKRKRRFFICPKDIENSFWVIWNNKALGFNTAL